MTDSTVTVTNNRPETLVGLDRLSPDPLNVRKTYSAEGIAELAASIKAVGLLKNLVVRFEAYNALVSDRVPVAEIAARFGKTDAYVRQRMALARVSPRILQAYRNEECTFDIVAAFTVSDDHDRQDEVWTNLSQWNRHPQTIKRLLAGNAIAASDRRVSFIGGLAAYEAAGGPVRRHLFNTTPNAGYALDEAMLESLVVAKLEAEAETIRAEGWAWVEIRPSFEWDELRAFHRVDPQPMDLTEEQSASLDAMLTVRDELETTLDTVGDDEAGSAEARIEELGTLIEGLTESRFTPADMAEAWVLVVMGYSGDIAVHGGLRHPEDRKAAITAEGTDADGQESAAQEGEGTEQPAPGPAPVAITHPAVLVADLTAQKTAALRVEFANNADVALVAVVHALLIATVYPHAIGGSALELRITHTRLKDSMKAPADNAALAAFEDLAENYWHALPGDPADLWAHLSSLSRDELLNLLAFAAAHGVNAVERPFDGRASAHEHANQLGQALAVDMTRWFTPTGASYFQHINRSGIEAAVAEAKGEAAARNVRAAGKKSEAVIIAERLMAGSGWLPAPVRVPTADAEDTGNVVPFDIAAE